MKIIFYNIKNFIRQHRGFFLLMIITIFFSSSVMLFSYGLFQHYKLSKKDYDINQTSMSVSVNRDDPNVVPMTKGELLECISSLESNTTNACELMCVESFFNDCEIPLSDIILTEFSALSRFLYVDGEFRCYSELYKTLQKQGWFLKGRYYTDSEYQQGEPLILLPSEIYNAPSDVIIQGRTYKKTASIKGETDVIFTALHDETECNFISFEFKQPPSLRQYNDICNTFKRVFGDRIRFSEIEPFYQEDYWLYNTIMLVAILIAIIASINLIILYQYILLKRRKTLSVFMICGCNKGKAVMYYLAECMLITIPCFIISALFYHNVLLRIFARKFTYIESAYSLKLYVTAFIIYIFISSIAMLITSNIMVRKTSIVQLKAGE